MAYIALYRKYRSQNFDEIAGQNVIVKTLKNAVIYDKIAHAYIFSGPRGTGKTSIAKIFGKAINCLEPKDGNPCNNCVACKSISDHEVSDIIEIDAASNNGVDEIRDIRDKVRYAPSVGKYKVYIIDEVHMLTTGAFNALLKTLEEPPKHVVFILATTEIHKIPATILSRCQRYDFKNIDSYDMTNRLKTVISKEEIKITPDAIEAICNFAEGGMRDALSLLDQVLSFNAQKEITEEDVQNISGGLSKTNLTNLLASVIEKNVKESLSLTEELFKNGKDTLRVITDLITAFKEILLDKTRSTKKYPKFSYVNVNLIYQYFDIIMKLQQDIRYTNQKKTYLEIAILKMIESHHVSLIALEAKVDDIINNAQLTQATPDVIVPLTPLVDHVQSEPVINSKDTYEPKEVSKDDKPLEHNDSKINNIASENSFIDVNPNEVNQQFTEFKQQEPVQIEIPLVTVAQLQEVLDNANKTKRELLVKHWDFFANHPDLELASTSRLLHQGQLVAISEDKAIIVFGSTLISKKMYEPTNKQLILKIFNNRSEIIKDYYAITKGVWEKLMEQYKSDRINGIEKPQLKQMDLGLYQTSTQEQQESELKQFANWFKGN